jgi:hypothetical protein
MDDISTDSDQGSDGDDFDLTLLESRFILPSFFWMMNTYILL